MSADALARQVAASTPDRSSWVAANAGSGKTRVLTERVARLLLAGTDPQKILCLTYTKAAAAEMQSRLFRTLGSWSMLDDAPLRAALDDLEGGPDRPHRDLDRARTLFARALETPGGLKIQTIHAFCEALLRRFPLEARVSPQFQVLEERQGRALREAVLNDLARQQPDVVAIMARHLSGDDPDPLLRQIGQHRAAFEAGLDLEALAGAFGIRPGQTPAGIFEAMFTDADAELLGSAVPLLQASGPTDARAACQLALALAAERRSADRQAALEAALLFGPGAATPFAPKAPRFPVKAVRSAHPDLCAALDDLAERVAAARDLRLGVAAYEKSAALARFAPVWLAAFDARKAALGLLDFDDMIDRARELLAESGVAAWVLWRLDGGLDHILVDEAQDTSPAQWDVVRAISSEFFAGSGARAVERTIFVVGDEKQSIYSFQGADPAAFGAMRRHFDAVLAGLESELARCDLIHSFRSAPPILQLVDAVFAGSAGSDLDAAVTHAPIAADAPGRVELWPFEPKPDMPDMSPWDQPVDMPVADDPVETLARRIAGTIRGWLDAGRALPGIDPPRAVRAGDVMILVQRRSAIFEAIIRALKQARVPVAGADVLRIGGELAVRDLLAVLRFAATPDDDLSLACVLRSPLGGASERDLFELAHPRRDTLWAALPADGSERWRPFRGMLGDILNQSGFLRPFELMQRLLIRHGGRARLIARLGPEAEDGIDALLDQAMEYERAEPPSLTGFLGWIDRDEVTVKRRVEDGSDQVRVMTVHGAKGLEAPIVILPDTGGREGGVLPDILRDDADRALWRVRADDAPPAIRAAEAARRARARAENMRLLYVALTRAEQWLIVAGAGRPPAPGSDGWHALVEEAMERLGAAVVSAAGGPVRVLESNWSDAQVAKGGTPPNRPENALPDWARHPAPRRSGAPGILSPSGLGGAHVLPGGSEDEGPGALARGEAIHLLLEILTRVPQADWAATATRVLAGIACDAEGVLAEATGVLAAPELAFVFGEGSLAEVEVTAALSAAGGRLLGRIDRLVVEADRVLAVDFKSNRALPATAHAVPEAILRQMGAYRACLTQIWPDRAVATAVLWTAEPSLMHLPDEIVDAALGRVLLDPLGRRA